MTVGRAVLALMAVWVAGAFLFPLGGMIHVLPIAALVLWLIDRHGREDPAARPGSRAR